MDWLLQAQAHTTAEQVAYDGGASSERVHTYALYIRIHTHSHLVAPHTRHACLQSSLPCPTRMWLSCIICQRDSQQHYCRARQAPRQERERHTHTDMCPDLHIHTYPIPPSAPASSCLIQMYYMYMYPSSYIHTCAYGNGADASRVNGDLLEAVAAPTSSSDHHCRPTHC